MFILHSGMEWIVAGFIAFLGLMFVAYKIAKFKIFEVCISIIVWTIVYKLHGNGTAVGAMTATVAALLFDMIGYPLLKLVAKNKGK